MDDAIVAMTAHKLGLESTESRPAGSSTKGKTPKLYVAMLVNPAFK
jgi:hypothetical protein